MPPALALLGRTHLLVLHFPIATLFAVVLLDLLWLRRPASERSDALIRLLLAVSAVGAVVAVVTGLLFDASGDWSGHTLELLSQHKIAGIVTAVLAVVAFVAHVRPELRRGFRPALGAAALAVTFTGHRGGEMVYGEGYITKALHGDSGGHDGDDDDGPVVASDGDDPDDQRLRYAEGKAPEHPDFAKDIKPIFERSCIKCHGPEKKKGGLRLDEKSYALKGGKDGPAIVPGDVGKSLLCKYVQLDDDDDDVMPSKGKLLAQSEIETLKRWVDQGADWPE